MRAQLSRFAWRCALLVASAGALRADVADALRFECNGCEPAVSAQAADGSVYFGGAEANTSGGALYRWRHGGLVRLLATEAPVVALAVTTDNRIVCGSADGVVRLLRADGIESWRCTVGGFSLGSVAIGGDGTIYCGGGDGSLHALTGAGVECWSFSTNDWISAAPVLGGDGTLYFGSWDGGLYAVSASGQLRWRTDLGSAITAAPAMNATGGLYVGTVGGELVAVRCTDGAIGWRFDTGGVLSASPVVAPDGTIYVGSLAGGNSPNSDQGYFFAVTPDGALRWRIPVAHGVANSAVIGADGAVLIGGGDGVLQALEPSGAVRWSYGADACVDGAPMPSADGLMFVGSIDGVLHVLRCAGGPALSGWPMAGGNPQRTGRELGASTQPIILSQPQGATLAIGASGALAVSAAGRSLSYQWTRNGCAINGAAAASLALPNAQPDSAGLYVVTLAGAPPCRSEPAIVGLTVANKVAGEGEEVGPDIVHPNGNTYDQILLRGPAASITADAGQVTRISFVDPDDDIVQVEFSGAGTLTLVLDGTSGPANPAKYNQVNVAYMKGRAAIVITGADETSNVSVFSVGRLTAVNQGLFRRDVFYDGLADIAFIAIASANGRFGGVRAANACFAAEVGYTGIYAPGVEFAGPVYVGNIVARGAATPGLWLGSAADVRVTGGDLHPENGVPLQITGVAKLTFAEGASSHGVMLAAQRCGTELEDGGNVTAQVAVNPTRPTTPDPVRFGVHSVLEYGSPFGLANHVAGLERIGARVSRNDFLWAQIEPAPGQFDWTTADEVVNALTAAHIEPLMVIWNSPAWANGSDDVSVVPTDEAEFGRWLAGYRNFARALALRYRDRVSHWELWNEPNIAEFWKPAPSPEAYARWATAIESELRAVDPLARVAYGCVTIPEVAYNDRQIAGAEFIRGLYRRHVRPQVVSVHPYMYENEPPEAGGPGDGKNTFRDVLAIRDVMLEYGADSDIWITEYCWWSGPMFGNPSLSLTEEQQADYFARSLEQIRRWPYVRRVVWFWDWDRPGSELNGCGLIRVDGTLRPAAAVLQNATK